MNKTTTGLLFFSLLLGGMSAQQLRVAVQSNLTGLDPSDANDTLSHTVSRNIYEGLLTFDQGMQLKPSLALRYDVSPDSTVYTFYLRRGVKFHDGTPFDAQAVKVNIERLADPANRLKRHSLVVMVNRVEVVDDYTVKVLLKEPFGALPNNLAHPGAMIISPAALQKYGRQVNRNPVGTGPFVFVEWKPDRLTLKKNANYWQRGMPKVDGITVISVPESGSRVAMLRAGDVDMVTPFPSELVSLISSNKKFQLMVTPSIVTWYVAMNNLKKPFDDVRVRQALNYAINKEAFIKVAYRGYGKVLDSILPTSLKYYHKQGAWPYDLAKAKKLLAEAGYPKGFKASLLSGNTTASRTASQVIQQQLAAVGVELEVENLESGVRVERIWGVEDPAKTTVQMYLGGWSSSTGDADWAFRPLLSGDAWPPKLFNVAYYKNAEVDELLKKAYSTADENLRDEYYEKAQQITWGEAPWIYLAVTEELAAKSAKLNGVFIWPDRGFSVRDAEFSP